MRIPLSWLAELVTWTEPVPALLDRLSLGGLKVEAVERVGDLDPQVVVGRLCTVTPHPGPEALAVCVVDIGTRGRVSIVSGAPGLAPGQHVAVALPGTTLPGGRVVAARDIRGAHSQGMLCSELDCGLGAEKEAVLLLEADHAPGTPLCDLPGVRDTVVELEVTANRGDCLSLLGVAREVAAILRSRAREPRCRVVEEGPATAESLRVVVESRELCRRYAARIVRGVQVGRSPFLVRLRLHRAGMRAVNDIVDATNYIMLEQGQPLHAFDLGRIAEGQVVVRTARVGERLVTLDGVERILEPEDLVIADARGPLALAGVMGGRDSEVSAATSDILLESAVFSPRAVRRTSRRLGIFSEAAYRFERRVDPTRVPRALDAVAAMIQRAAGGQVARGIVEDAPGMSEPAPSPIRLRPARAQALLGMSLPRREIQRRLRSLGATVTAEGADVLVAPPPWRPDLAIEADLVEEIARLGGYDAVPSTPPLIEATGGEEDARRLALRKLRRLLVAEGLSEMVTLAFVDAAVNDVLPGLVGLASRSVAVANPLSSEFGQLRRSPLAGLVRAVRLNVSRGATGVAAFELGKGYGLGPQGEHREPRAITIALWGHWPPRGLERSGPAVDFFDLKGVVSNLLAGVGHADEVVRWQAASDVAFLHPGKAARIEIAGQTVGLAGALHPTVMQVCDLPGELWVAELDFEGVASYRPPAAPRPIPRFPAVNRDIAVVVDESFEAEAIRDEVRRMEEPLIESVRVFDCYRGAPIPAGKKSLAYAIGYRALDRTLTDDEVNAVHDRLRERLRRRFTLEFRS